MQDTLDDIALTNTAPASCSIQQSSMPFLSLLHFEHFSASRSYKKDSYK